MESLERYRQIVTQFDQFIEYQSRPLPVTARINTLKTSRQRLLDRLERSGVGYRTIGWYPLGLHLDVMKPGLLPEHLMGHIHPQEEISMAPAVVLDPRPGEEVLDMCASPGGKTSQIAQMMENTGMIVANEPSGARIVPLRSNCERLGACNVVVTRYDGRRFPMHRFDRVLLDAPCSALGMARRDPSALNRWSIKRSLDLQRLQSALLRRALDLTAPGGTVVYSTCTYSPEENEGVVASALTLASVERIEIPGLNSSPGLACWNDIDYGEEMRRCARFYPHQNDTGGFFVAKLIKL